MADDKVKDKKEKKKNKEPGKVRRWFRDFFSELKKVTWPSFTTVVKQTGVVLLVTVIFLLVMMAFDAIFGLMYKGLISGLDKGEIEEAVRALLRCRGGLL